MSHTPHSSHISRPFLNYDQLVEENYVEMQIKHLPQTRLYVIEGVSEGTQVCFVFRNTHPFLPYVARHFCQISPCILVFF